MIMYDPSNLTLNTRYITPASTSTDGNNFNRPFIFAYPATQTLTDLSPRGTIAGTPVDNESTIRIPPATWP